MYEDYYYDTRRYYLPFYSEVEFEERTFAPKDDLLIAGERWTAHEDTYPKQYKPLLTDKDFSSLRSAIRTGVKGAPWLYTFEPENEIERIKREEHEKTWIMGYDGKLPKRLSETGSWKAYWDEYKKSDEYVTEIESYEAMLGYA